MTTYRLPDWLGGYEVNRLTDAATPGRVNVTLSKGEGLIIEIDIKDLVEVKPPLPPEPPNGFIGMAGEVWERDDLAEQEGDQGEGQHWWRMSDPKAYTWPEVCERAPEGLQRLIPDPADDAPELPWRDGEDENEDKVHTANGSVYVSISPGYITPDEAELRAAVILRAVRAAREVEQP